MKVLQDAWENKKAEFVMIYGRRRMGKTELVKRFMEKHGGFYFLARQQRPDLELGRFRDRYARKYNIFLSGDTWEEIFRGIAENVTDRQAIIIDEFPYWVVKDSSILSEFQYIWDEILKGSNIVLILLGSYVSVMEQRVMGQDSPLYGRRTAQIELKPMHVRYLREFLPEYDTEDRIRSFGAVDSIPYYMAQFIPKKPFWGNIESTFMNTASPLYMDAEILLSSELREFNRYFDVIKAIIDGSTRLTDIAAKSWVDVTNISKYLRVLEGMKLIRKLRPVTAPPKDKNYLYEVEDNYIRFYLTYVYPYKEEIEAERGPFLSFVKKDYQRYMGRIFERFVEKSLRDIVHIPLSRTGRWWQKEEEIDIVGLNEHGREALFVECKWQEGVDGREVLEHLVEKAEHVRWNRNKEYYALFARSFSRRPDGCLCFDTKDMERALWGMEKKR